MVQWALRQQPQLLACNVRSFCFDCGSVLVVAVRVEEAAVEVVCHDREGMMLSEMSWARVVLQITSELRVRHYGTARVRRRQRVRVVRGRCVPVEAVATQSA